MQNAVPLRRSSSRAPASWVMDLVLWGFFVSALALL